jgi:hypothetical protein
MRTAGPVLTRLGWRLPLARPGRVSRGPDPSCSRRTLSHRLVGWCGDHLSGLQAETGARVPALPSGGAAPRGAAASLAHALCPTARPAAAGGQAGAARVPHVRGRFSWLRPALVWHVPDERALPVLLSRKVFLPVVREEAPAPVGGVAAEGGARARSASPRRLHHATPPAGDLPQASAASLRPLAVRRRGRRRVRQETNRRGHSAWNRRVHRDRRGLGPSGDPLKVVACITDSLAIRQILKHLDLSPPEKPPPDIRDVLRVPVDEEGREIEVQPA